MNLAVVSGAVPPSPFPGPDERRLVPRLQRFDSDLIDEFRGLGTPLVSQAMRDAKADTRTVVKAVALRLAVVLDPECENNQLSRGRRAPGFAALEYSLRGRWTGAAPKERKLQAYVARTLEEERAYGSHAFIAPNHVVGGAWSEGRQTDLRIQRLGYEYFVEQGLGAPSPTDESQRGRSYFIGATFSLATLLDASERRRLVALYAALPGAVYWVRVHGLSDRAPAEYVEAGSEFLFALHVASERQVVVVGPGNLAGAFLASGLSVAIGFGSHEYYAPYGAGTKRSSGMNYVAQHRTLMRNVSPRHRGDFAHAAFAAYACRCGHHPPDQPPANGTVRRRHSASCRLRDWFELALPSVVDAETEIDVRLRTAAQAGAALGEPQPFPTDAFRAVKRGADRARSRRWRQSSGE